MAEKNPLSALALPEPDLSRLPVDFHVGSPPMFGAALMIAGVVGPFVVGGIFGLLGLVGDMPANWGWIVLGFAAIPLLALPWGWFVMHSRTIVRVGEDRVEYLRTTPLGTRRWEEKLSSFTAIAYRKVLPPSSSTGEDTRYAVELLHPDGKRNVRLVKASDEAPAYHVQKRLAELTGIAMTELDPVRG